jgi:lactate permease
MGMYCFFLSWSPILVLVILAAGFRMPALHLSWVGAVFTLLVVVLFFNTSLQVALLSAVDGVLITLPLLLVVFGGILLSTFL